jgi:glycosyltransferase involved in cell wall biosynthesis
MPRVSVLLPTFQAAITLPAAIASIQSQTLHDWEMVAVDDGSTDATPTLLAALSAADPRIRVFRRPHTGLVASLNLALEHARAPLIARMDADDISHPERLEAQVAFLDTHSNLGLVGCQVAFGGDPAVQAGYALHVHWLNTLLDPDTIARQRFIESPFAHPSVLFKRDLVDRYGGYRAGDFPEDYELWLRWLDAGVHMAKVPRPLLTWTDTPNRLSRTDPRYRPEAFYRCKATYLARHLHHTLPPTRRIFVWGAGRPTRRRADFLRHALHPFRLDFAGYIDIDPRKIGRRLDGIPVIAPVEIPAPATAFIVAYVAKRGAHDLISDHLNRRGYLEGRDWLFAA